jgi:tetratricopeptide (TPR) repeat protein
MKKICCFAMLLMLSFSVRSESFYQKSEKARGLFEKGEALEAAAIYRELLQAQKDGETKAVLQFDLGTSLLKGSDYSGAVDVFYAGLPSAPQYLKPRMLYNLAHALYKAQRRDEALSTLRETIIIKPDFDEARLLYEWILLQKPPEEPPPEDNKQPPPPPPPPMLEELPPPPPDVLQDEMQQSPDPLMKPW